MAFSRSQKKSLATGFGLILAAAAFVILVWVGTYLPGFAGEFFSVLAGLMWTPLILDLCIFLFGVILIFWLNGMVRAREGDEYVYLEQVEGPEVPPDIPSEARSAVFREEPEPQGVGPALASIEGALELDDLAQAADLLFRLPPEELDTPAVLALRIRLAEKQERPGKAAELRAQLRLRDPRHPLLSLRPTSGS